MLRRTLIVLLAALPALAQTPSVLEGDWRGTLKAGDAALHLSLHIEKASDGLYSGSMNSLDQGAVLPFDSVTLKGDKVRFEIKSVSGLFDGTLAGDKLSGTWNQGAPLPLEFSRQTKASGPAARPKLTTARMKPFGVPVNLHVPVPPAPVMLNGKTQLLYELDLTNLGGADMELKKLEVLGDGKKLASYEAQELNSLLFRIDVAPGGDNCTLPPGTWAVAFLAVAIEQGGAAPKQLQHRVTVEDVTTEGPPVAVSTVKPLVLGPPLRGDNWLAANGPSNTSVHRRALIPVDGQAHIAQRFAIDWLRMGADGKSYTGDPKDNKSYHAYGSDVLAVADGVVVAVKDGIPENVPGISSRAVPITLETVGGNHVVLDLGGGRFAFYAHLQPGKVRVHVGDKVKRGQVLGLLGNSGNSTEPHLHFHVSNGPSPLGADGLPFVLDSLGALPAQNTTVKFAAQ
jgi:murein DD-endopeptidase